MSIIWENDKNRPVCFWSWNGDITDSEIKKQLLEFADKHIGGVVIHSRAGLKIQYMGERWFAAYKYAVSLAESLDIEVWIYDEDGWPSGFAGGMIPALGTDYQLKYVGYNFGDAYLQNATDNCHIIGLYKPLPNGRYEYKQNEDAIEKEDIVFWYTANPDYVDLLNSKVTDAFIAYTHERYAEKLGKWFGTVIKGFFTDEPQMNCSGYAWSIELPQEFENNTGLSLLDNLWMIAVDVKESHKFRYELWKTISGLYNKNYVKKLSDWCAKHSLMQTGHFPAEDGLVQQLSCCGDVMQHYYQMQLPGIDHLGDRVASPVLMKQVSSISNQFNDGSVLSETFGCAGWGVSFKELAWIWGGQSVLGITKPCYHLSAYSIEGRRKRDYPAFYSYQEPWWESFHNFDNWMIELNHLMTEGKRDLHTLVLSPMVNVMSEYKDPWHDNTAIANISAQFRILIENLLDCQLDFEIGNEALICEKALVANGVLTLGNCKYDTVFVPEIRFITPELLQILSEFAFEGGCLYFCGGKPEHLIDGTKLDTQNIPGNIIANRGKTIEKMIECQDIKRFGTVCSIYDNRPIDGIYMHTRTLKDGKRVHIWSKNHFPGGKFVFRSDGIFDVYKYDIQTGKEVILKTTYSLGESFTVIELNEKDNLILNFREHKLCKKHYAEILSSQKISDIKIIDSEKNCLVIDKARISTGIGFSELQPVIWFNDELYSPERTEPLDITVRYCFNCDSALDTSDVELCFEDEESKQLTVNGIIIAAGRKGWWIDKCIGVYEIGEQLHSGENVIDISYNIPVLNKHIGEEAFESELNRFYYPVELESVYIRGNFDVIADESIDDKITCLQVGGKFSLAPATEKRCGDLTRQNMWFYRGNVKYKIMLPDNSTRENASVRLHYHGTAVVLRYGDKCLTSFKQPVVFQLESDVKSVEVEIIGTNRNLLGPHHHIDGDCPLVTPYTFIGKNAGFEQFTTPWLYSKPKYTEKYGFIPYGLEKIELVHWEDVLIEGV